MLMAKRKRQDAGKIKPACRLPASEKPRQRRKIVFEALEPRMLLSADSGVSSSDFLQNPDILPVVAPISDEYDIITADSEVPAAADDVSIPEASTSEAAVAADSVSQQFSREIVIIDPVVQDYQSLIDQITSVESVAGGADGSAYEIIVLDAGRDGIDQISEILARYQDVAAVHIFSHGASGALHLGSGTVTREQLISKAVQLKDWDKSLIPEGDILLYGCSVAEGEAGIAFMEDLSELTNADVAASTDATGRLGGNWMLEQRTGVIDTLPLFQTAIPENYFFLLEEVLVDGTSDSDTIFLDETEVTVGEETPFEVTSDDVLTVNGSAGNDDRNAGCRNGCDGRRAGACDQRKRLPYLP